MNELSQVQHRAIQLKYDGIEYADISKEINTPLQTIKGWFMSGGILEVAYNEFAKKHNDQRVANALEILRATTNRAAQAIQDIVDRAINRVEELKVLMEVQADSSKKEGIYLELQKAEDRLIDLSEKTLDRGGLGIIRRVETKKINQEDREEVIRERLKRAGIDVKQLRFISPVPTGNNQGVRA